MNTQIPPEARIKPYSDFSFKEGEAAFYVNLEEGGGWLERNWELEGKNLSFQ